MTDDLKTEDQSNETVKDRIDPLKAITDDKSPEAILQDSNEVNKNRWLAIFIQLTRSQRFVKFIESNYKILDRVDEEKKTIDTMVYENPKAVGPPLELVQTAKIFTLLKMYNTRHPQKVLKEILGVLDQNNDGTSVISSATSQDIDKAVEESQIKLS
jgi:hypothetical protein